MYCGIRKLIRSILAFHDDTGCNHAAMVIAAYLQRGKFTLFPSSTKGLGPRLLTDVDVLAVLDL